MEKLIKNKKILIVGEGISGKSAFNLLTKKHQNIHIVPNDTTIKNIYKNYDILITSPGIPPKNIIYRLNRFVLSEFELGYLNNSNCKWIGITGTNGKTTVTSMLGEIYNYTVGNIGFPTTSLPNLPSNQTIVSELSSAQLMNSHFFKPHICTILNISPNHIDFHGSYKNYIKSKLNIVKFQTEKDFVLLSYQEWGINLRCKSHKIYFNTEIENNCVFRKENNVYLCMNYKPTQIFTINTTLIGEHNKTNSLIAGTIGYLNGESREKIEWMIKNFNGLEHRLEKINTESEHLIINDSKSTTSESCIAAIESFKNSPLLIIVIGGRIKGINPYPKIFKYILKKQIIYRYIFCYGESGGDALLTSKELGLNNILIFNCLEEVILDLKYKLTIKNTILFSPACSSFDQFENYIDRGNIFKKYIKTIIC